MAFEWLAQVGRNPGDKDYPIEARSLGRTRIRWMYQITALHRAYVSNGPTHAFHNLIRRVKGVAIEFYGVGATGISGAGPPQGGWNQYLSYRG
jgi:hypothetical protein